MKLLRHGAPGQEKPGLLDADGNIRDLSGVIEDVSGEVLSPEMITKLGALDTAKLPQVPASVRLGACVGRPSPVPLPWEDDGSVWDSQDMWATADQSRDYLLGLYRRAWQHSDESLATIALDASATVAW